LIFAQVVNFGLATESLDIYINGLNSNVQQFGSTKTVLTSTNLMDENSFLEPKKVPFGLFVLAIFITYSWPCNLSFVIFILNTGGATNKFPREC